MPFTTYFGNLVVNFIRGIPSTSPSLVYASLHSGDTGATGSGLEISGSGYARAVVWLDPASGKASTNGSVITFTGMPAATITWAGITPNATGGSQWFLSGSLSASKITNQGDQFQFSVGDFDLVLL